MAETVEPSQGAAGLVKHLQRLQEGIDKLDDLGNGLAIVVKSHEHFAGAMALMVDVREMVNDNISAMHTQMAAMTRQLQILEAPVVVTDATGWRVHVKRWGPWLGGVLLGAGLYAGAWWGLEPTSRFKALAVDVHSVLEQHFSQLPKGTQERVREVYTRHGFQEPATATTKGR